MATIKNIINILGYNKSEALYYNDEKLTEKLVGNGKIFSILKVAKELNPFALYLSNNKPFILFFEINDEGVKKELYKKVWNAQIPIVIISFENRIEIYNGQSLNDEHELIPIESFALNELNDSVAFSFWNLSDAVYWNNYEKSLSAPKLDTVMLDNIKFITSRLRTRPCEPFAIKLVLRLIFIRYLVDRGVDINYKRFNGNIADSQNYLLEVMSSKSELYRLFLHLKNQFNGNLFELYTKDDISEENILDEVSLGDLQALMAGNLKMDSGQFSLFPLYDFNIIPVELISNIYERFLGDDKQRADKAFYTPPYLVDYLLEQTITPYLENNTSCRVLDPACGSGIFLVETVRRLIEKNIIRSKGPVTDQLLKQIVIDNIWGIDKNPDAIDVAIFSIYLTILDYKDPRTLKGFQLPLLKSSNIYQCDFFSDEIDNYFSDKKFDFIIGNPPWGKAQGEENGLHIEYCLKNNLPIQGNEISRSFILRTKDFATSDTKCCLIVTSKLFYNMKSPSVEFRKWLLTETKVSKYIELAAVRELIFDKARGPAGVVFYSFNNIYNENIENELCHLTMKPNIFFKLFNAVIIEKNDYKYIKQSLLIQNDWAWKTIVFGTAQDFHLIEQLRKNYKNINDVINTNSFICGRGLQPADGDKDARGFIGRRLIETKKGISAFKVDVSFSTIFRKEKVFRIQNEKRLFTPPYVLIKKGFDTKSYKLRAAYSEEEFLYQDAITAISGETSQKQTLLSLTGLINSSLYAYFNLMLGTSAGIEREQGFPTEIFKYPAIVDSEIAKMTQQIQDIKMQDRFFQNTNEDSLLDKLDQLVIKKFGLENNAFVDYALKIEIPLLAGETYVFKKASKENLESYSKVFIDYFTEILDKDNEKIRVKIYDKVAHHFVAIEFIIDVDKEQSNQQLTYIDANQKKELDLFSKFMLNKVNDSFYQMKDVIGFEKKSFYILKTDEMKNWHPAMARLDLADVMDSILNNTEVSL